MMKKDNEIKWIVDARKSFKDIKKEINEAPILVSPYFVKILCFSDMHMNI